MTSDDCITHWPHRSVREDLYMVRQHSDLQRTYYSPICSQDVVWGEARDRWLRIQLNASCHWRDGGYMCTPEGPTHDLPPCLATCDARDATRGLVLSCLQSHLQEENHDHAQDRACGSAASKRLQEKSQTFYSLPRYERSGITGLWTKKHLVWVSRAGLRTS